VVVLWNTICSKEFEALRNVSKKYKEERKMGLLRGGLAAAGAWKLGGGIISTILIFILLYWLLGFFMR
jgi:hypothetical protein